VVAREALWPHPKLLRPALEVPRMLRWRCCQRAYSLASTGAAATK
jgi:hypothetical protein